MIGQISTIQVGDFVQSHSPLVIINVQISEKFICGKIRIIYFFLFFGFDMISDIVEANFHRYG